MKYLISWGALAIVIALFVGGIVFVVAGLNSAASFYFIFAMLWSMVGFICMAIERSAVSKSHR